jgi:hypothetical protein
MLRPTVIALVLTLAGVAHADRPPACRPSPAYDAPDEDGSKRPTPFSRKDFLGKRARRLLSQRGEPECRSARLWRYYFPPGCSDWRTVVTLWFRRGKVVKVNIVTEYTGEECAYAW